MSARSIRVSPAPDLPTWAHTPADYASPQRTDGMDEEIGANGSIAGLFVEDDEKVGLQKVQKMEDWTARGSQE